MKEKDGINFVTITGATQSHPYFSDPKDEDTLNPGLFLSGFSSISNDQSFIKLNRKILKNSDINFLISGKIDIDGNKFGNQILLPNNTGNNWVYFGNGNGMYKFEKTVNGTSGIFSFQNLNLLAENSFYSPEVGTISFPIKYETYSDVSFKPKYKKILNDLTLSTALSEAEIGEFYLSGDENSLNYYQCITSAGWIPLSEFKDNTESERLILSQLIKWNNEYEGHNNLIYYSNDENTFNISIISGISKTDDFNLLNNKDQEILKEENTSAQLLLSTEQYYIRHENTTAIKTISFDSVNSDFLFTDSTLKETNVDENNFKPMTFDKKYYYRTYKKITINIEGTFSPTGTDTTGQTGTTGTTQTIYNIDTINTKSENINETEYKEFLNYHENLIKYNPGIVLLKFYKNENDSDPAYSKYFNCNDNDNQLSDTNPNDNSEPTIISGLITSTGGCEIIFIEVGTLKQYFHFSNSSLSTGIISHPSLSLLCSDSYNLKYIPSSYNNLYDYKIKYENDNIFMYYNNIKTFEEYSINGNTNNFDAYLIIKALSDSGFYTVEQIKNYLEYGLLSLNSDFQSFIDQNNNIFNTYHYKVLTLDNSTKFIRKNDLQISKLKNYDLTITDTNLLQNVRDIDVSGKTLFIVNQNPCHFDDSGNGYDVLNYNLYSFFNSNQQITQIATNNNIDETVKDEEGQVIQFTLNNFLRDRKQSIFICNR